MKSKKDKGLRIYTVVVAVVVVVVILIAWIASSYNGMMTKEENVNKAWGNVETLYQRRADLIPNIEATVKGYAKHESETLQNVTNARAVAKQAEDAVNNAAVGATENEQSLQRYTQAQQQYKEALDIYVNAVREAYPELKANQNFLALQTELEGSENRIAVARQDYNEAVKDYNVTVRKFPAVLISGMLGFEKKPMFQSNPGAENAPKVSF